MKKNLKWMIKCKTAAAVVLSAVCIVLSVSGCAADKSGAVEEEKSEAVNDTADNTGGGQSITDMDRTDQSDQPGQSDSQNVPTDSEPENENQTTVDDTEEEPAASDSKSLYEQFLSGEASASVSSSYPDPDYVDAIIQKGDSYTLTELGQQVSKYFLDPEYTDKTSYDSIQYAYITCPDSASGKQNLLVKFVGLNIYTQDDNSYAVFVITEDNGQLSITYQYQCWARSETVAFSNGILSDSGSGGAGDHYGGLSVILADGTVSGIYGAEVLSGWWTSYVDAGIYSEVFGADMEPGGFIVSIYTIGDDRYYLYDMSECTEEERSLCENYIAKCQEEQGINWITDEEIQTAIRNRCSALGISYESIEQKQEAVWNNL